jgi:hypothetical protein
MISKLCGLDLEDYLRYVLERIAGHPIRRIEQLLPWNVAAVGATPRPCPYLPLSGGQTVDRQGAGSSDVDVTVRHYRHGEFCGIAAGVRRQRSA